MTEQIFKHVVTTFNVRNGLDKSTCEGQRTVASGTLKRMVVSIRSTLAQLPPSWEVWNRTFTRIDGGVQPVYEARSGDAQEIHTVVFSEEEE